MPSHYGRRNGSMGNRRRRPKRLRRGGGRPMSKPRPPMSRGNSRSMRHRNQNSSGNVSWSWQECQDHGDCSMGAQCMGGRCRHKMYRPKILLY